jgi:carotenoid cleavage dioxygenase-like enzyme
MPGSPRRPAPPYTWNPAHPARIGLLPRDGVSGGVRWLEIEPCWIFHTLNAYDDDNGRVVVDVCRYRSAFDVATMTGPGPLTLDRRLIDPVAGKIMHAAWMTAARSSRGSTTG